MCSSDLWSMAGLALVLEQQGKADEAEMVRSHFDMVWAKADVTPVGSRL